MARFNLIDLLTKSENKFPKDFVKLINSFQRSLNEEEVKKLWGSYKFGMIAHGDQKRRSRELFFTTHCVSVGKILASWNLDIDTISAGLLHDTIEDTDIIKADLVDTFSDDIADLVSGVTKLSGIKFTSQKERQAENFMKMFLSIAKDIRVIIIKFADRLNNMRTIKHLPIQRRRRIASETREIYAPLAHRLGMGRLKNELEDLSFQVLDPDTYYDLSRKVESTRTERKKIINRISKPIDAKLAEAGIKAEINGRAKHHYSIYKKITSRGVPIEQIYDFTGIRILVDDINACYATLGIVHQLFKPHTERFKDYLATPKSNGYQSLHTSVVDDHGKVIEIQIRTREMDKTAEEGVAAHWAYKKGDADQAKDNNINRQIRWLRELVEIIRDDDKDPLEFLKLLKISLFQNEIHLFTPKGEVITLHIGATPVDFAFAIHSEVGFHCRGAHVNGEIVPLNTELRNGDTVKILISKKKTPNPAWLKFVKSAKAQTHIKRWIKKNQYDQGVKLGKEIIEKTLRRLKKTSVLKGIKKDPLVLGYKTEELVHYAVGIGRITVRDIIKKYLPAEPKPEEEFDDPSLTASFLQRARGSAKGIKIGDIDNALVNFAKCCNPIPGDDIVGYITRGRGITIHRSNCNNIPVDEKDDRLLNIDWDSRKSQSFMTRFKVVAEDRKFLLRDVTESISKLNINIGSVDVRSNEGIFTGIFIIQVRDIHQLIRLTKKIRLIPGLIQAERK